MGDSVFKEISRSDLFREPEANRHPTPGQSFPLTLEDWPKRRGGLRRTLNHGDILGSVLCACQARKARNHGDLAGAAVTGEAGVGLPKLYLDHGEALGDGEVINQAGD